MLTAPQPAAPHVEAPGPLCRGSVWGICSLLNTESRFCFQTEKPILSPAHRQWRGAGAFHAEAAEVDPPGNQAGPPHSSGGRGQGVACCALRHPWKAIFRNKVLSHSPPPRGTSPVGTMYFLPRAINTQQPTCALWGWGRQSPGGGAAGSQHALP